MSMNVLGIETSCDETAAAVVRVDDSGILTLLSNVIVSQIDIHREFGGVVPEVAARSHIEVILPTIEKALYDAFGVTGERRTENGEREANSELHTPDSDKLWSRIDAIAVTHGPGLSGSLLIGTLAARTLSLLKNKPLYPIHHVEGHTYANFITEIRGSKKHVASSMDRKNESKIKFIDLPSKAPEFPLLSLTVSGGHSQFILFRGHGEYRLLGQTQDDAVGEAFDKVAKILGLEYPGGPSVAKAAERGDSRAYDFPTAKLTNPYDFSFSGLKTAVLRHLQKLVGKDYSFPSFEIAPLLSEEQINDTAASFQRVAVETLVDKTVAAYKQFKPLSVVIAGGVAANQEFRRQLKESLPINIEYAPPVLCTDNAAMIAARGCFSAQKGNPVSPLTLEINPSLSM